MSEKREGVQKGNITTRDRTLYPGIGQPQKSPRRTGELEAAYQSSLVSNREPLRGLTY